MEQLLEQTQNEVFAALISGPNGIVWYTTPGLHTNPLEIANIWDVFNLNNNSIYDGFEFQGKNFAITSMTDNSFNSETNLSVLSVFKSDEFMVLTYDEEKKKRDKCCEVCKYMYEEILKNKLYLE